MSVTIEAILKEENPEFKKHYETVQFCLERSLSFPLETAEFFKEKLHKLDLQLTYGGTREKPKLSPQEESKIILEHLRKNISIPINYVRNPFLMEIEINVQDIPKEAHTIVIKID